MRRLSRELPDVFEKHALFTAPRRQPWRTFLRELRERGGLIRPASGSHYDRRAALEASLRMDGLIEPVGSPPNIGLLLQYDTLFSPMLRSSVNLWPPRADAPALAAATEVTEAVLEALAARGVLGHVSVALERRPMAQRQGSSLAADSTEASPYVVTEVTVGVSDAVAGAFHIGALLGRRMDAEAESAANADDNAALAEDVPPTHMTAAKGDVAAAASAARSHAARARRRSTAHPSAAAGGGARRRSSLDLSPFHLAWSSDLMNSGLTAIHATTLLKLARCEERGRRREKGEAHAGVRLVGSEAHFVLTLSIPRPCPTERVASVCTPDCITAPWSSR